jgi:hypothetical protein
MTEISTPLYHSLSENYHNNNLCGYPTQWLRFQRAYDTVLAKTTTGITWVVILHNDLDFNALWYSLSENYHCNNLCDYPTQ